MHPPLGFVRVKIGQRNVLCRTLVDSGNLFGTCISKNLADKLKLRLNHSHKRVGTADKTNSVRVIGRAAKPFRLFIENIKKAVLIRPYVLEHLSHPINLGQAFLRQYNCDMYFRGKHIVLKILDGLTCLESKSQPLHKYTVDDRIKHVLQQWKRGGGNPPPLSDMLGPCASLPPAQTDSMQDIPDSVCSIMRIRSEKRQIYTQGEENLAPHSAKMVRVCGELHSHHLSSVNSVFIRGNDNNPLYEDNEILMGEGIYSGLPELNVLVCNHTNRFHTIPKGTLLGYSVRIDPDGYIKSDTSVNELDTTPDPPEQRDLSLLSAREKDEWRTFIIRELRLDENHILNANKGLREQVIRAFMNNLKALARNGYDFGRTNLARMYIDIKAGSKPVKARVRPLNPLQEADLARQIDEWTKSGVIEPSNACWASALVPVAKKGTNQLRWCVDFRQLNSITIKDVFPLPNIQATLNKLAGSRIFSTWDSKGAYHSIELAAESRDLTTFISPIGLFRYICVPFGLCNAGQVYSRMINKAILLSKNQTNSMSYLDDVITHSNTLHEHVKHVESILAMHAKYGLKLNLKKCQVFQASVQYLGHVVSEKGIEMLPSHVEKILNWKVPETGKELQSFLGFVNYYSAFLKEYGKLSADMNGLRNKKGPIELTASMKSDFEKLKQAFSKSPVRAYPDFSPQASPFILDTDYSAKCCGGILSQMQNGQERFIACCASKNNAAQASYPSHKGELLAVVTALQKFEHLLQMRQFLLRTDSSCLTHLSTMKQVKGMFARWQLYLSEFDFKVEHRAGTRHVNADVLSRRDDICEETPELSEGPIVSLTTPTLGPPLIKEISRQTLIELTSQDDTLSVVLRLVREGVKPPKDNRWKYAHDVKRYISMFECLSIENGLLILKLPSGVDKTFAKRICIPDCLRKHVWLAAHTANGHLGNSKTAAEIHRRFYFPNISSYVELQNRNCVTCIAKQKSFPKPTHVPFRAQYGAFNECVFVDTVGPLNPSGMYQGKRVHHILTMQDGFTRFLVAVPIPDVTTRVIAHAIIEHWIHRFSCPVKIHSDNGTGFTSKLMQELMKMFHIQRTYTPPYVPQSNRVERAHKLLGQLLRSDNNNRSEDWVKNLSCALFVYNTTVNRFTGLSPLEALTTRKPRLPIDMVFRLPIEPKTSWEMYVDNLKDRYYRVYKTINDKAYSQTILDNSRVSPYKMDEISEGDHVYYYLARAQPNSSPKISVRWIGPLIVENRFSESLYKVKPIGNWCKKPRAFCTVVNKLRKVDKDVFYEGLSDKAKAKITLPSLLRNFHETDDDSLIFDTGLEKTPFKFTPLYLPVKQSSEERRERGCSPFPEGANEDRGESADPSPSTFPSSANESRAESPERGVSDPDMRSDSIEREDESTLADNGDFSPPRRTARSNVFRGRFNDGFNRRGKRRPRYP